MSTIPAAVTEPISAFGDSRYSDGAASQQPTIDELRDELEAALADQAPAGDLLFADDFADLRGWGSPYNYDASYAAQGARVKENVELVDGVLSVYCRPVTSQTTVGKTAIKPGTTLMPGDWAAGAIAHKVDLYPGTRLTMDLRMPTPDGPSNGGRGVALLWPTSGWPANGELDFVENGGVASQADRQETTVTNHWFNQLKVSATNKQGNDQRTITFGDHDFTQWTRVEVLWLRNAFVVTFDGHVVVDGVGTFTDHIPAGPMHLTLQTAVEGGGRAGTYGGQPRRQSVIQLRKLRGFKV